MDLKIVGLNLKLLREEASLSQKELSSQTGITVDRIDELEKGLDKPYYRELDVLLPILKLSEEDLFERDLVEERKQAYSNMKKSNKSGSYDWYYGSKKNIAFYLISIAVIVIVGAIFIPMGVKTILALVEALKSAVDPEEISEIQQILLTNSLGFFSPIGIVTAVLIVIEIFRRTTLKFQYWYIFVIIALSTVIIAVSTILSLPFLVYCIYRGIILHGKNR